MVLNWREKLFAAGIHFVVTLALAALAAAVIFLAWFPGELAQMSGGQRLFVIVICVDVALGPLISLVIYSSAKPRSKLIFDYTVVGIVQVAALLYGMFAVAGSRPVFIAFTVDRLEIVSAVELEDADLAVATEPRFRSRSVGGPRYVAVELPTDPRERNQVMLGSLDGKDIHLLPRYYRGYDEAGAQIDRRIAELETLLNHRDADRAAVERAVAKAPVPRAQLGWLLAHHRFGFAAALIDRRTRRPVAYVPMRD